MSMVVLWAKEDTRLVHMSSEQEPDDERELLSGQGVREDSLPRRLPLRWLFKGLAIVAFVFFLLFIGSANFLYFGGLNSIGADRLRNAAENALRGVTGSEIQVSLGDLRLGMSAEGMVQLEIQDSSLAEATTGAELVHIGRLRFGVNALALLGGSVEINQISIARVDLSHASANFFVLPDGDDTLITPKHVADGIMQIINKALAATDDHGLRRIRLSDIRVTLGEASEDQFQLANLQFETTENSGLTISGNARIAGISLDLSGVADRSTNSQDPKAVELRIKAYALSDERQPPPAFLPRLDNWEIVLRTDHVAGEERWFILDSDMSGAHVVAGRDDLLIDRLRVQVGFHEGDKGFTVLNSNVNTGRSSFGFEGMIVPETKPEGHRYTFELATRHGILAPASSPEPAMSFAARATGEFLPSEMRLLADRIEVRTSDGLAAASASVLFSPGLSPGISFAMDVERMPAGHAKQLWPWVSAPGAREWVLGNLFGGTVYNSHLRVSLPPGRLGNGVPLGRDEVSGRFLISQTRFDLTGDLPPVRDSDGWVEFYGTDVKVGLVSGTAFMPSGRQVHASNGTLELVAAHQRPRIGKLDIDISGKADAIAEFAGLNPINATILDLQPADVSGDVQGNVKADIPLHDGIPVERLSWDIVLEYDNLSLAKPVEGQMISNGRGIVLIDKERLDVTGDVTIDGAPSSLSLMEPLGRDKGARSRHIRMTLDDKQRNAMIPGLSDLVSGPIVVTFQQDGADDRQVDVDLSHAQLSVPWIGWQKGRSIPASASFRMSENAGETRLSDFRLQGDGFGLAGTLTLAKGSLRKADFSSVRFNRDDDFSATVTASAGQYKVVVKGRSFDARSIVKLVLGDTKSSGRADDTKVVLKANLDNLHGFNGIALQNADIDYSTVSDTMTLKAATPDFGAASFTRNVQNGRRTMTMVTENGGAVLKFLDFYANMEGGVLTLALAGPSDDNLTGRLEVRNFWIVNEARLGSLVAAGDQSPAARASKVDARRVKFETAAANLAKGDKRIDIELGVLRGSDIGLTFQGMLFDAENRIAMTGTFMPLYGLNRIFGELPVIGQILGNGRDRGLIGITFKLMGDYRNPGIEINPISLIAPGIFRQLFEFSK